MQNTVGIPNLGVSRVGWVMRRFLTPARRRDRASPSRWSSASPPCCCSSPRSPSPTRSAASSSRRRPKTGRRPSPPPTPASRSTRAGSPRTRPTCSTATARRPSRPDSLTLPSDPRIPRSGSGTSGTWADRSRRSDNTAYFRYEVNTSQYSSTGAIRIRSTGRSGKRRARSSPTCGRRASSTSSGSPSTRSRTRCTPCRQRPAKVRLDGRGLGLQRHLVRLRRRTARAGALQRHDARVRHDLRGHGHDRQSGNPEGRRQGLERQ